jgi:signal peptidase I
MEPTIKNGESVLASGIPYLFSKPKVGDIVVFRRGGKVFIKRVVKIDPSSDGDRYFVKGDNEKDSLDSRVFGWIERKDIIGKLIHKISKLRKKKI